MIFESAPKTVYLLVHEPYRDNSNPFWWGYGADAAHDKAVGRLGDGIDKFDGISVWELTDNHEIKLTRVYHYDAAWKDQPEWRYAVDATGNHVVWEP